MFQENSIETCILSRVKQITSPGWMHETGARTWCTGKTQRERVEREAGGGVGMGNTCKPMAVSFQCMTKSTTKKKQKVHTLLPPVFSVGPSYRCNNYTEFSCKTNYRCIPKWAVCNGVNDCRDNSDEQDCGRRGGRGGGRDEQVTRRGGWISHVILPLFASDNTLHFIVTL